MYIFVEMYKSTTHMIIIYNQNWKNIPKILLFDNITIRFNL